MKLTLTSVLEVEKKLNEILFLNVQLGGLCAGFLYPNIFYKDYESSTSGFIKNKLLNFREIFLPDLQDSAIFLPADSKNLILNITSSSVKNLEFFSSIYSLFDDYRCIIISKEKKPFLIGNNDLYLSDYKLTSDQHKYWLSEYRKTQNKIAENLQYLKNKYGFPISFIEEMKFVIKLQTKRIVYFIDILKKIKPHFILTDHDRHGINSSLILTGNTIGIPTFTFIHGSTHPTDHYYPLLAKHMICWGNMHKKQFVELGIDETRLIVCGNQKITRDIKVNSEPIKLKLGINNNETVILLVTNPIDLKERMQYVIDFCSSIYQVKQFKGVVRIHPSEKISDYKDISELYPSIIFTDNQILSFDESICLADHVINHNSVFGIEALIKQKDVIIYSPDYITFPLGIGAELHSKGGCTLIKNTSEMIKHFNYIKVNNTPKNSKAEEYIQSYIYAFGETASKNIYNEITKRISQ